MNQLIDWTGKTEELVISYDTNIYNTLQIPEKTGSDEERAIYEFLKNDNLRDITAVNWDNKITKADKVDYLLAIASGMISGLLDIFYVGEFSLENASKWGSKEINKFVIKTAQLNGYKGEELADAIPFLERNYGLAADKATAIYGGGLQHHLRDFSHHFSLGGLVSSIYTQFTGNVIGTDTEGKILVTVLKDKEFIGNNFEEKIFCGVINWFFHMVSDMAGSSSTVGNGTGIPGPIVSLIKEVSSTPIFRDKRIGEYELHIWISKLFNGTLLGKRDKDGKIIKPLKFDLRTEIGLLHEVGKQFMPVIVNECLVRSAYFIRHLTLNLQKAKSLNDVDIKEVLPFNNRIISRMITISSGTFTAIDAVDATVRATVKNGGLNSKALVSFALRINYVGIGRMVIACKNDAHFIIEDYEENKQYRQTTSNKYEQILSDLKCLTLDYEQMQVLQSIEKLMIEYDIVKTKDLENKNNKMLWKDAWKEKISNNPLNIKEKEYFLSEEDISKYFKKDKFTTKEYLIILESLLFKPYFPFEDLNKKKLKFKYNYLKDVFINIQTMINKEDIINLEKEYKKAITIITGSSKKMAIGAAGTITVALATGGLGFAFAPTIATMIVGESAAGLSGAALVSYSLAAIGGGSLAAGGLGMAGGTAIITGGGALIGMLGGGSISTITTVNLLQQDSYVLSECAKLLTFSKVVLYDNFKDYEAIKSISAMIQKRTTTLNEIIDKYSSNIKENKMKFKAVKKSIKYLDRCNNALLKLIK